MVSRTKEEAKRSYDRISKYYDYLTGAFKRKYAELALERLSIGEGETVLEIGFGTGRCLKRIAESVGQTGKTYSIDISSGMMEITKNRLCELRDAHGEPLNKEEAKKLLLSEYRVPDEIRWQRWWSNTREPVSSKGRGTNNEERFGSSRTTKAVAAPQSGDARLSPRNHCI